MQIVGIPKGRGQLNQSVSVAKTKSGHILRTECSELMSSQEAEVFSFSPLM
jgi:hypothetical protein